MEANNNDVIAGEKNPFSLAFKLKDGAIFLGIMYCLGLVVALPAVIRNYNGEVPVLVLLGVSLLVLVIVHLLFNWMYYLIIIFPAIISGLMFLVGWAIYIMTPFYVAQINLLFTLINFMAFGSFDHSWINNLNDFFSRIGQFLIAVGGIFWWFVQKGSEIKYRALAVYLVFIAFLGAVFGLFGPQNVFFFLFLWLIIYLKIGSTSDFDKEDLRLIAILFKLGATITVISGLVGVNVIGSGIYATVVFSGGNIWDRIIIAYQNMLYVLIIIGIWTPIDNLKKLLPPKIREPLGKFYSFVVEKGSSLITLKLK